MNLDSQVELNRILMEVYEHVKGLGFDNGFINDSYNFVVSIPNLRSLNEIFGQKLNEYLTSHPNEGLQTFVDDMDGQYIEQVLHDLACILQEYDMPFLMPDKPNFLGQITRLLRLFSQEIEPTEYAMTYKEMHMNAADYFTLMYDMLLKTVVPPKGGSKKRRRTKKSRKGRRKSTLRKWRKFSTFKKVEKIFNF